VNSSSEANPTQPTQIPSRSYTRDPASVIWDSEM
jgi:hypothetical protein